MSWTRGYVLLTNAPQHNERTHSCTCEINAFCQPTAHDVFFYQIERTPKKQNSLSCLDAAHQVIFLFLLKKEMLYKATKQRVCYIVSLLKKFYGFA